MITIECPLCTGTATLDDDLAAVTCATCDTHVELAADPLALASDLDRAA